MKGSSGNDDREPSYSQRWINLHPLSFTDRIRCARWQMNVTIENINAKYTHSNHISRSRGLTTLTEQTHN